MVSRYENSGPDVSFHFIHRRALSSRLGSPRTLDAWSSQISPGWMKPLRGIDGGPFTATHYPLAWTAQDMSFARRLAPNPPILLFHLDKFTFVYRHLDTPCLKDSSRFPEFSRAPFFLERNIHSRSQWGVDTFNIDANTARIQTSLSHM